jgi:hypothetical protein
MKYYKHVLGFTTSEALTATKHNQRMISHLKYSLQNVGVLFRIPTGPVGRIYLVHENSIQKTFSAF